MRTLEDESTSHKLALLVDEDRYVGSLQASALGGAPDSAVAGGFAERGETVAPDAPADVARERAMSMASSRLPVVDADGRLAGIIAVNSRRDGFCGT